MAEQDEVQANNETVNSGAMTETSSETGAANDSSAATDASAATNANATATTDTTATAAEAAPSPEEITYHAVEKDGQVTAIWEMQGRKHLRTIDPRSRQGQEILRLYTAEHHEEATTANA